MHFLKESGFLDDRQADWEQFKYLVKHKKDVYQSGRELGASPFQLIKHDWTKFKPSNWVPYRNFWFGPNGAYNVESRSEVENNLREPFREAANRHLSSEEHHMHKHPDEAQRVELEKVPLLIRKEMISDWHSVAKRTSEDPHNFPGIKEWAEQKNLDWMYKKARYMFNIKRY